MKLNSVSTHRFNILCLLSERYLGQSVIRHPANDYVSFHRPKDGGEEGGENGKLRCPAPTTRLRVEKIEGGLMVAGVVVAANCQIILPIFGFLFLLVGCVLTGTNFLFTYIVFSMFNT